MIKQRLYTCTLKMLCTFEMFPFLRHKKKTKNFSPFPWEMDVDSMINFGKKKGTTYYLCKHTTTE